MIFNNNTKQKKDTDKIKNMHPVKNEKETKKLSIRYNNREVCNKIDL
jgi:hypothetical protein